MAAIQDTTTRHLALACGLGAGKTHTTVRWAHDRAMRNPQSDGWFIAPSYQVHTETVMPYYLLYLHSIGFTEGIHFRIRSANSHEKYLEYSLPGVTAKVWFKSAKNWQRFVGKEIAWFVFEEPAWTKLQAFERANDRVRCPLARTPHQSLYAGTPDIVPQEDNWYYNLFAGKMGREMMQSIRAIHAPTAANPHRPRGYIDTLLDSYGHNKAKVECYIFGLFRLVAEGIAIDKYTRQHVVDHKPRVDNKTMHLSWDFNVGHTYWCTTQTEDNTDIVCAEIDEPAPGTYDAVQMFKQRFPLRDRFGSILYKDHSIFITGDAAGYQSDTTSKHLHDSDFDLILHELRKDYPNVELVAPRSNPYIRTRIEVANNRFHRNKLRVSSDCTILDHGLLRTTRDDLISKKSTKVDTYTHPVDALTYDQTDRHPIVHYGLTESLLMAN